MEITSVNNDLVKEVVKLQQKKYRDKTCKFLLEGRKCIEEAILAGLEIEYIFINKSAPTLPSHWGRVSEGQEGVNFQLDKIIYTTEPVLKKISTTDTPPDIVGVAYKKETKMPENAKKVVLLENIKDMGNLGTILRTSVAFGADAVVLYGKDCADIYNPKCVRSAVGNLWKIPVIYIDNFEELKRMFKKFECVATLPRAKEYLKDFEVKEPVLVMFGSEADGLSDELVNFSSKQVKIEMSETVESLNLSVSCAIVLYKLFA